MRKDYAPGTKVKLLATGEPAVIKNTVTDSSSHMQYTIVFDKDGRELMIGADEIAPPEHPLHAKIAKWRENGLAQGFEAIVIGIDSEGVYKAFFCNTPEGYGRMTREHREIKFKYYWRLKI